MKNRPISSLGKVLFVGAAFPPSVGGSVVVMRELLKQYDSNSYNIVTLKSSGISDDKIMESRTLRIGIRKIRPYRLGLWVRFIQMPFVLKRVCHFARLCDSKVIVCVYPTIDFLFLGMMMARRTGLPLVVYMHDTLKEALSKTSFALIAKKMHAKLKELNPKVLVISEGMRSFYINKYGIESVVVPHMYAEPIAQNACYRVTPQLFWAGAIYGINDKALLRVISAANKLSLKMTITGRNRNIIMQQLGGPAIVTNVEVRFYEERRQYLDALSVSGIMVLALNHLDETDYGQGEMSTIFPTKTPEYLAAGAPILVHCPKNYFLANFFEENKCGLVVDKTDEMSLMTAIRKLLSNDEEIQLLRGNALKAAKMFSPNRVCSTFSKSVSEVLEII